MVLPTERKEEDRLSTPARRGRKAKPQSWGRDRTKSESSIIELIKYGKRKERESVENKSEEENPEKRETKE